MGYPASAEGSNQGRIERNARMCWRGIVARSLSPALAPSNPMKLRTALNASTLSHITLHPQHHVWIVYYFSSLCLRKCFNALAWLALSFIETLLGSNLHVTLILSILHHSTLLHLQWHNGEQSCRGESIGLGKKKKTIKKEQVSEMKNEVGKRFVSLLC